VIAGVCGGVGEYFSIDPNAIRLIYTVVTIFTGVFPGVLTYVLAILIVPVAPTVVPSTPVDPEVDEKI
jgi:phage shock protein C